ncbi:hypothetical protein K438DRAFT_1763188 [Mycena galopus ATCC 62051]|nr:hypothetical protein K438DRAFT_1763188 [Mycena galopus ATCC 62051]
MSSKEENKEGALTHTKPHAESFACVAQVALLLGGGKQHILHYTQSAFDRETVRWCTAELNFRTRVSHTCRWGVDPDWLGWLEENRTKKNSLSQIYDLIFHRIPTGNLIPALIHHLWIKFFRRLNRPSLSFPWDYLDTCDGLSKINLGDLEVRVFPVPRIIGG